LPQASKPGREVSRPVTPATLAYDRSTALFYEPFMFALTLGRYRSMVAREVAALGPRPDARALDLCCGTGMVAGELARRLGPRGEVVAVDSSPAMLAAARRKLSRLVRDNRSGPGSDRGGSGPDAGGRRLDRLPRAEFVAADASDLPLPDASFDLITLFLGLHEVEPDRRLPALREVRRVLRPGGIGVILDLRGRGPAWKLRLARWAVTAIEGPDAWTITEPGVTSLIERAGLEADGSPQALFWGIFESVRFRRPNPGRLSRAGGPVLA